MTSNKLLGLFLVFFLSCFFPVKQLICSVSVLRFVGIKSLRFPYSCFLVPAAHGLFRASVGSIWILFSFSQSVYLDVEQFIHFQRANFFVNISVLFCTCSLNIVQILCQSPLENIDFFFLTVLGVRKEKFLCNF